MINKNLLFTAMLLTVLLIALGGLTLQVSAADVTSSLEIDAGGKDISYLTDENPVEEENDNGRYAFTRVSFSAGENITLRYSEKITGIYIIWHQIYGEWTLSSGGTQQTCGINGFLHEYAAIETPSTEITLTLPECETQICEIYAFTQGELPDWVQVWNPPCEKADIMLLSTHSDDEHLFFCGILPAYAGQQKLKVQVVYMTNHWDTANRPHEQINGLWAVGVRNYPIVGPFPDDADTLSQGGEAVSETLARSLEIFGENKLIEFQVKMIERFQPQVIIAHDIEGEYHHGAHMANTWSLQKALEQAAWDVPKTYIHLWPENTVTMDWDQPLSEFGGKTAYEVSKLGYACHDSQHWTWFTRWLKGDGVNSAADIATYSPCKYGLYRTMVGTDTGKNDFMENITPYQDPTPEPAVTEAPASSAIPDTDTKDPEEAPDNTLLITVLLLAAAAIIIVIAAVRRKKK